MTMGNVYALIGVALAVFLSGTGSMIGLSRCGQAAMGVLAQDPSKFGKVLPLQLLMTSQGLYGFVVGFISIWKLGIFEPSGMVALTDSTGLAFLAFCLPVSVAGFFGALFQGQTAASGIVLVGKREEEMGHALTMSVVMEIFAIFAFLVSFIGVFFIQI